MTKIIFKDQKFSFNDEAVAGLRNVSFTQRPMTVNGREFLVTRDNMEDGTIELIVAEHKRIDGISRSRAWPRMYLKKGHSWAQLLAAAEYMVFELRTPTHWDQIADAEIEAAAKAEREANPVPDNCLLQIDGREFDVKFSIYEQDVIEATDFDAKTFSAIVDEYKDGIVTNKSLIVMQAGDHDVEGAIRRMLFQVNALKEFNRTEQPDLLGGPTQVFDPGTPKPEGLFEIVLVYHTGKEQSVAVCTEDRIETEKALAVVRRFEFCNANTGLPWGAGGREAVLKARIEARPVTTSGLQKYAVRRGLDSCKPSVVAAQGTTIESAISALSNHDRDFEQPYGWKVSAEDYFDRNCEGMAVELWEGPAGLKGPYVDSLEQSGKFLGFYRVSCKVTKWWEKLTHIYDTYYLNLSWPTEQDEQAFHFLIDYARNTLKLTDSKIEDFMMLQEGAYQVEGIILDSKKEDDGRYRLWTSEMKPSKEPWEEVEQNIRKRRPGAECKWPKWLIEEFKESERV